MTRVRAAVVVGAWAAGVALGSTVGLVLWAVDRANRRPLISGNFDRHPFDWPPESDGICDDECGLIAGRLSSALPECGEWVEIYGDRYKVYPRCQERTLRGPDGTSAPW